MDLQYVFMVVATVLAGLYSVGANDMSSFNSKKIYCGRILSQTLSEICQGNYNSLNKKSEVYYPYKSKASASSLMSNRRRRRGVFNECCEKPCSHEELSSYCGSRKR